MGLLKVAVVVVVLGFVAHYFLWNPGHHGMDLHVGGMADRQFKLVQDVFKDNFEGGWKEREGAAFAVYHKGKLVVDLWGGYADTDAHREWEHDTISTFFSSTKSVCAVIANMLVDRGFMKYDALVTKYWPEFGKHGKDNVTIEMLLTHQAGLAHIDKPIRKSDAQDWKKIGKLLEDQPPNWPPGTATGYHMLTFGWLIDQLVRRVDPKKRSIGTFLREEIAQPYDVDFHIGLPKELEERVARMHMAPMSDLARESILMPEVGLMILSWLIFPSDLMAKASSNPKWMIANFKNGFNDPKVHQMEIGAAGGIGSARGMAKLFSLLNEKKLIKSDAILKRFLKPTITTGTDKVIGITVPFGWGFMYSRNPEKDWLLGHPGYGGQNVKLDMKHDLAFAYVTNSLKSSMGDHTAAFRGLQTAVYQSIGIQ